MENPQHVSISEFLQNPEQYLNKVLELEGVLTVVGTLCHLRSDKSLYKVKADQQTIFIDLDRPTLERLLKQAFNHRSFEVHWGVYQFPVKIHGRIEPFSHEIVPFIITDITRVKAKVPFHKDWVSIGNTATDYLCDGFIIRKDHLSQDEQNTKTFIEQLSIVFHDENYEVDLGSYYGDLAAIVGKVVKVNGALYSPISTDYPKDHIALYPKSFRNLEHNINWLWLDDKSYHRAIYMLVMRNLSSRDIPICQDTTLIGRLMYVPNQQVAPIKVDEVTNLMIENLRYIRFRYPVLAK
jgi:hypothetical protein